MRLGYPDLKTAKKIWQEGLDYRTKTTVFANRNEYIFHTTGVASAARKIAEKTMYLNPEKAYVLGLLHDYGKKYDEFISRKFHAKTGYDELFEKKYFNSAQICLTHSFPYKDFKNEDYKSYYPEWLDWARNTLKTVVYDEYDYLIQLCDCFFEGMNIVSFEKRFEGIMRRYNLSLKDIDIQIKGAERNKSYFDKICNMDVYELLNINHL